MIGSANEGRLLFRKLSFPKDQSADVMRTGGFYIGNLRTSVIWAKSSTSDFGTWTL